MDTGNGRQIVLLDLDGTLTRSDPGIVGSVVKAYHDFGLPVPSQAELRRFIGPSIPESLRRNQVPESYIEGFVKAYRQYYSEQAVFDDPAHPGCKVPGKFCSSLYDGVLDQLHKLKNDGFLLAVASCKPEYQATSVCERFGIDGVIDYVFGASADGSRVSKEQVIRYGFAALDFVEGCDKALMVGDRWTDVDGARACGIDCLGCGWGYADENELESHRVYEVVDDVDNLASCVNTYFLNNE